MTPILNNINNGVLYGLRAMPMKDSTSSNENVFSMSRLLFTNKSYTTPYYGQSRNKDASARIDRLRIAAIGRTNPLEPISFLTKKDNSAREALQRVRSRGAIAPAKKTHNYHNAPIFY